MYKVLPGKSLTTNALTAAEIITQMQAMGWSLFDDMSGSYYKIMVSQGETGLLPPLYAKIGWSGSTVVTIDIYTHWNATTHTSNLASMQATASFAVNKILWMWGNKNFVVCVQETTGSVTYAAAWGHIISPPSGAVNTSTTSSVASGSSVVVPVASVVGFVAGAKYQIYDPTTGYRQVFTCTSVGASDITADSLGVGYASGCLVGTHPWNAFVLNGLGATCYVANSHKNAAYNTSPTTNTADLTCTNIDLMFKALSLPAIGSVVKRKFFPVAIIENYASSYRYDGTLEDGNGYFLVAPVINSANANDGVTAADFDAIYMGQQETGTTTGSNTVTTLNDTSKAWTTNQYANKVLVCTGGTEVGQIRKIISNTATQLVVDADFSVIPVSGTYAIADRGYRYLLENAGGIFLREGV